MGCKVGSGQYRWKAQLFQFRSYNHADSATRNSWWSRLWNSHSRFGLWYPHPSTQIHRSGLVYTWVCHSSQLAGKRNNTLSGTCAVGVKSLDWRTFHWYTGRIRNSTLSSFRNFKSRKTSNSNPYQQRHDIQYRW